MSERLVEFLYVLARQELPIGIIEGVLFDHVSGGEPDEYCNTYLEAWARDVAKRLTDDSVPVTNWQFMYNAGGEEGLINRVSGIKTKELDNERPPYPVGLEVILSEKSCQYDTDGDGDCDRCARHGGCFGV